jgi:hypothetical protein
VSLHSSEVRDEPERELAHWQLVAEERRLKRRLARRIGNWPFLQ